MSQEVGTIIGERTAEAGIRFEFQAQELPVVWVYGSPLHLRQIFLNIYGNCIKYNREGGSVSTETCCLGAAHGRVIYRWTISDTGVGMSREFLKHLFEPFAQEAGSIRGLCLLLVEDNDLNAEIAQTMLADEGARVTVAENGKRAVERFQSSLPGTFDAILMDVMMPVMDGLTATRAIARCCDKEKAQ